MMQPDVRVAWQLATRSISSLTVRVAWASGCRDLHALAVARVGCKAVVAGDET